MLGDVSARTAAVHALAALVTASFVVAAGYWIAMEQAAAVKECGPGCDLAGPGPWAHEPVAWGALFVAILVMFPIVFYLVRDSGSGTGEVEPDA